MSKILRVVDVENWIEYPKAKWVASEFKMAYQKFTEKLNGSKINNTRFVYGTLEKIKDNRIFKSKDQNEFLFKFKFTDKNKMEVYYIIEIDSKLIKISKENGEKYLNQLIEV